MQTVKEALCPDIDLVLNELDCPSLLPHGFSYFTAATSHTKKQ